MNAFLNGFADELVKEAILGGALKSVGGFALKHPLIGLSGLMTVGATAAGAAGAYKEGLKGGERPRYLAASADAPSEAAYTNYHQLFEHKPTPKEVVSLSKNYRENAYKR